MGLVEVRPEEADQRVSSLKAPGGREGKIGEQGQPLGPHEDRPEVPIVRTVELDPA
jgi:hypothetical protein